MTEQDKITTLYNQLPPDKKAMFMLIMQTFTNMMTMLTVSDQFHKN